MKKMTVKYRIMTWAAAFSLLFGSSGSVHFANAADGFTGDGGANEGPGTGSGSSGIGNGNDGMSFGISVDMGSAIGIGLSAAAAGAVTGLGFASDDVVPASPEEAAPVPMQIAQTITVTPVAKNPTTGGWVAAPPTPLESLRDVLDGFKDKGYTNIGVQRG